MTYEASTVHSRQGRSTTFREHAPARAWGPSRGASSELRRIIYGAIIGWTVRSARDNVTQFTCSRARVTASTRPSCLLDFASIRFRIDGAHYVEEDRLFPVTSSGTDAGSSGSGVTAVPGWRRVRGSGPASAVRRGSDGGTGRRNRPSPSRSRPPRRRVVGQRSLGSVLPETPRCPVRTERPSPWWMLVRSGRRGIQGRGGASARLEQSERRPSDCVAGARRQSTTAHGRDER